MELNFRCPHCQAGLTVAETEAGTKSRCPQCRKPIRIPGKEQTVPSSPAPGRSGPAATLQLGADLASLSTSATDEDLRLKQWLIRAVFGLTLVLAAAVVVMRGNALLLYLPSLSPREIWLHVQNPFIALLVFFNLLSALVGLYIVNGCVEGLRRLPQAQKNVSSGITLLIAVRVLHSLLVAYIAYRSPERMGELFSELRWLAGATTVGGTIIYVLSRIGSLRLHRKFALSESDGAELVHALMSKAVHLRASDLHLEPSPEGGLVRFRVDGFLFPVVTFPTPVAERVVSRVKVMGQMDIAERRLPQDGQAIMHSDAREVDLRISTVPTAYGERMVVRFLDREHGLLGLDKLGIQPDVMKTLEKILRSPHGIFFCTGPTGAGKSTTLYAALMGMNKSDRNVITVEDPIEFHIPGITQLPVSRKKGMSFASGLRSILRQDPDVIMVGEVRDSETAHMAIQAAQTGHLVLSTLHTNDAAGAVARMLDLGSEPFLLASSLRAVLAQRLVRRLCPACSSPHQPDAEELADAGLAPDAEGDFRKGHGCAKCLGTGYFGRIGVFELLVVDDRVRQMISERNDAVSIRAAAVAGGMPTLRDDGLRKARAGITTLEEVFRVTAADVR